MTQTSFSWRPTSRQMSQTQPHAHTLQLCGRQSVPLPQVNAAHAWEERPLQGPLQAAKLGVAGGHPRDSGGGGGGEKEGVGLCRSWCCSCAVDGVRMTALRCPASAQTRVRLQARCLFATLLMCCGSGRDGACDSMRWGEGRLMNADESGPAGRHSFLRSFGRPGYLSSTCARSQQRSSSRYLHSRPRAPGRSPSSPREAQGGRLGRSDCWDAAALSAQALAASPRPIVLPPPPPPPPVRLWPQALLMCEHALLSCSRDLPPPCP